MRTVGGWFCFVGLVFATSTSAWAAPPGTAFTYQGQLKDGGSPANGQYDLQFTLFFDPVSNAQAGSTIVLDNFQVTNGLFTATLDFGAGIITGDALWLQISVRPGVSSGAYTALSPRQALTPAPYALALALPYKGSANSAAALFNLTQFGNGMGMFMVNSGSGAGFLSEIVSPANTNSAIAAASSGSGTAIQAVNNGTGGAGSFRTMHSDSSADALYVECHSQGRAIFASNSWLGGVGKFQLTNPANSSNAVEVTASGTGDGIWALHNGSTGIAVHGVITQGGTAVLGESQGNGDGVLGESNGNGAGVRARNNGSTNAPALQIDQGTLSVTGAGVGTNTCVFIHRATAANINGNSTVIDHSMTNGDPNAMLIVTYNRDAPGVPFNNKPDASKLGVTYSDVTFNPRKWAIFHPDSSDIEVDTCFNVLVIKR